MSLASQRCFLDAQLWTQAHHLSSRVMAVTTTTETSCKKAKLQAEIKPTAFYSAIDKENSIEFPLDFLYYLYNYYMVCALLSYAYHVTHHMTSCDVML